MKVVFEVVIRRGLDAKELRDALSIALAAHAEVVEDPVDPFTFALFLDIDGISDLCLRIRPEDLEACARRIGELTGRFAAGGKRAIPSLLAGVAAAVSRCALTLDRPSRDTPKLAAVVQEILADFVILAIVLLARHLGYVISVASISKDQLIWALQAPSPEPLLNVFRQAVRNAAPSSSSQDVAERPFSRAFIESRSRLHRLGDSAFDSSMLTRERATELMAQPAMIDHASVAEIRILRKLLGPPFDAVIDISLERARPRAASGAGWEITARSYANLRSAARVNRWSDGVVLRLIEEYLNPALSPRYVYHSSTVSGDDWIRLHRRLKL